MGLLARQGSCAALVCLIQLNIQQLFDNRPQPITIIAQNPRCQHRVEDIGEFIAKITLHRHHIVFRRVENLLNRFGGEQRR